MLKVDADKTFSASPPDLEELLKSEGVTKVVGPLLKTP
jgi:hypothetical protein